MFGDDHALTAVLLFIPTAVAWTICCLTHDAAFQTTQNLKCPTSNYKNHNGVPFKVRTPTSKLRTHPSTPTSWGSSLLNGIHTCQRDKRLFCYHQPSFSLTFGIVHMEHSISGEIFNSIASNQPHWTGFRPHRIQLITLFMVLLAK